ncbi:hypothetical protein BO83DRAFT_378362 [Aspergillus eucalypticola CBS 122712]|uniref:Uncharacterized protein n=1 Tax=Aspergillus eucalypticola (strain CBS 122712 / IBT 29274) TaxID=1448314 RepID=A0A317VFW9_ASPEC|nr:uncharacterized protein BO83DRAFT_378362 [Aspergillus eucalypticola CBS 122712]PWY73284.1 hypothetical protein BO83DRAFT_378362 [Aspergillus eucalypticola CBS 122712]
MMRQASLIWLASGVPSVCSSVYGACFVMMTLIDWAAGLPEAPDASDAYTLLRHT